MTTPICSLCGAGLRQVPCPEGLSGCLTLHLSCPHAAKHETEALNAGLDSFLIENDSLRAANAALEKQLANKDARIAELEGELQSAIAIAEGRKTVPLNAPSSLAERQVQKAVQVSDALRAQLEAKDARIAELGMEPMTWKNIDGTTSVLRVAGPEDAIKMQHLKDGGGK